MYCLILERYIMYTRPIEWPLWRISEHITMFIPESCIRIWHELGDTRSSYIAYLEVIGSLSVQGKYCECSIHLIIHESVDCFLIFCDHCRYRYLFLDIFFSLFYPLCTSDYLLWLRRIDILMEVHTLYHIQ